MIVSCPQCSSRYRIRDDKIQGTGARITCPGCTHRFVVYRESEKFVIGGQPAKPRGVSVTFASKGQIKRTALPEEDDDDAPTTLMPHGSAMADQLRATLQAERDRMLSEERQEQAAPKRSPARPRIDEIPRPKSAPATDHAELRARVNNDARPPATGRPVAAIAGVAMLAFAVVFGILYFMGIF